MNKILCSKCLTWSCICGFTTWAVVAPLTGDQLELLPAHAPAAITLALGGTSSSMTVGTSSGYYVMTDDEITGQEYSAMSAHEYALQALKTTRPLVFKQATSAEPGWATKSRDSSG